MSEVHPGHFDFSMAPGVEIGMQATSPARADALTSYANGDHSEADEKFRAALGSKESVHLAYVWGKHPATGEPVVDEVFKTVAHDVETGRTFIDWARSTSAGALSMPLDEQRVAITEAINRARRGLVLLEQDQHQLASSKELEDARELLQILEEIASQIIAETDGEHDPSFILRRLAQVALPQSTEETVAA